MTALVIPSCNIRPHNRVDLLNLLTCLEPDKDKYTKIIVCFDGIEKESEFIEFFLDKFPFIHPIINELNPSGFSINSNRGLRYCRDELKTGCFLVNQDCILPAANHMMQVVGEGLSIPQSIEIPSADSSSLEEKIEYLNLANTGRTIVRTHIKDKFAFYCPYFSYELLKEVGLLQEDQKNVYSDDSYVIMTLLNNKFPVEVVDVKISHRGSHIIPENNWESGSGCYNSIDLSAGLVQHKLKWSIPKDVEHGEILNYVLKNFVWDDKMRWD